ncbi:MAG: hypothetical protein K5851_07225 [Lachnospiraceae bacterium]|nr:hypothetical protein [Lachnospiraceae bacterium]
MNNKPDSILKEDEAEISLKDLLAYCFLHWRSAIVICLVVGILSGAYKGATTYISSSTPKSTNTKEISKTPSALERYESTIASSQDYIDNSDLMKIDPSKEAVSTVTMIINSDDKTNSTIETLKSSYIAQLKHGDYLINLSKKLSLNSKYVSELVNLSSNDNDSTLLLSGANNTSIDISGINKPNLFASSITIKTIASNKKTSEALLDGVINEANLINENLKNEIGSHSLSFVSRTYNTSYDRETAKAQSASLQSILDSKVAYNDYKSKLQPELDSAPNDTTLAPAQSRQIAIKTGTKWFVIGAVLAFLCYGFILCLVYILSQTPITKEQFFSRYNFFSLGSFSDAKKELFDKNHKFDKWLRRIMGISVALDVDEVYELIAANLNVYQPDKKSFLCIGSVNDTMKDEIVDELSAKKSDCTFTYCEDIINNPNARMALTNCDAIIFVEKYDESKYEDIDKELELVARSNKEIAGIILY